MNTFFVLNFNAFDIKMKAQNIKKTPMGAGLGVNMQFMFSDCILIIA